MSPIIPAADSQPPIPAEWWTEGRFGMFIHWGVYAVPAGVYRDRAIAGASEWLMKSAMVPVAEYKSFAAGFTASAYDPEAWVRAAVDAGMSYVVTTAKHHDGFALWDTKVNDWNAVDACRRANLNIGF